MIRNKIFSFVLAGAMVASMGAVAAISVGAESTYSVIGTVNGNWDTDTVMSDDDGDGIYEVTLTLDAGDYEWKVRADSSWDDSWGEVVDEIYTYNSQTNCSFTLTETTDVTFYFDTTGDDRDTWPCYTNLDDTDTTDDTEVSEEAEESEDTDTAEDTETSEDTDTAEDTEDSEDTDTEDTEDSEDTDTEDTEDSEDTDTEDTETSEDEEERDFPATTVAIVVVVIIVLFVALSLYASDRKAKGKL